jgi:hypothetical protein
LVENGFEKFNINNIQNYVKAYRDNNGRLWICNPILPIKDSIELREIITHLICDGSALLTSHRTSKYASTSREAVKEFLYNLKIFGKIVRGGNKEITIQTESGLTKGFKNKYVSPFPKALTKILIKNLKIKFDTFNSRFPKQFFIGNRNLLVAIVRAFLIDEGYIKDTRTYFVSANKKLLNDLEKIFKILNYKYNDLKEESGLFSICISAKSIKTLYKDIMKIRELSIVDKQERLELGYKLSNCKKKHFLELEKMILEELERRPMTLSDLSYLLTVRIRTIWFYVKKLEREGKIKVLGKAVGKGGAHIWSIS